jgi:hypothetical protein
MNQRSAAPGAMEAARIRAELSSTSARAEAAHRRVDPVAKPAVGVSEIDDRAVGFDVRQRAP